MPDDEKPPNPLEDLRKGLGLLFRAAKTTIEKLPTGELEEAVLSGAKEVGRAIENVTHSVEEQFLRKPSARASGSTPAERPAEPGGEAGAEKVEKMRVETEASPPADGSKKDST